MKKTAPLLIVALIVFILGSYFVFIKKQDVTMPAASSAYGWEFAEREQQSGVPQTEVFLVAGGTKYRNTIGTFDGSCSVMESDYLPGERSKVICWWAGGGKEIGLFEEGNKLVVKVGDVDEGTGETEGFRGNFEVVEVLR